MEQQELTNEIRKLREQMDKFARYYNVKNMFLGGVLRGMGILVGATLLVLIGSAVLNVLGLLPGFSDIVQVIADAFERAKLQ